MSEIEQEFVSRLIEAKDLQVIVHGWGHVPNPPVTLGDLQLVIPLKLDFDRPATPIPVSYFDLELRTISSGITLYRERQSAEYGNQPLLVGQGTSIQMVWHIGIRAIDPNLIKTQMPGVYGLTSRGFDKDTGALTFAGNMKLTESQKKLLVSVRKGEASVRQERDDKTKN